MFKNTISFLAFSLLYSSIVFTQIDPRGDIFEGEQPMWSHVAIDTTAIGYQGRTGMDKFFSIVNNKIILKEKYAYIVYNNFTDIFSGSFIEKIDINTGESIWQNGFDLRNSTNREYTSNAYINDENELELLNFRNYQDTFILLWNTGKLSSRKFDLNNGMQLSEFHSPNNEDEFPELYFKFGDTKLNKTKTGGYDYYKFVILANGGITRFLWKLDNEGKLISKDTFNHPLKFRYLYRGFFSAYPFNLEFDTLVAMRHSFANNPFKAGDSMSLLIDFFDDQLNLLDSFDLTNQVGNVKEYEIFSTYNSHISMMSREYFLDGSFSRQRLIVIDNKGQVKEEIVFQTRTNDPFGQCVGVYKLKNEPGVFIINRTVITGNPGVTFYKSDGNGNMKLLKELTMKNTYTLYDNIFAQLEDGDILLNGQFRRRDLSMELNVISERVITTRWSAKDLGLVTATDEQTSSRLDVYISPNPLKDHFFIHGLDDQDFYFTLFDANGHLIQDKKFVQNGKRIVQLNNVEKGIYYFQLVGLKNVLLFSGKLIVE